MSSLKLLGELAKLGYSKFEYNGIFLHSSLSYHPASFRNLDSDFKIYSFENDSGNSFYMWSFIYEEITKKLDWDNLVDSINFGEIQFYINSDQFLIPKVESVEDFYCFSEQNTFTRPTINSIDNRLDLGDKRFIVSNAGVLFSIHEKPEHKLLDFDTILPGEIKIIIEKTLIGTLNTPFEIKSCHLIPIDSSF